MKRSDAEGPIDRRFTERAGDGSLDGRIGGLLRRVPSPLPLPPGRLERLVPRPRERRRRARSRFFFRFAVVCALLLGGGGVVFARRGIARLWVKLTAPAERVATSAPPAGQGGVAGTARSTLAPSGAGSGDLPGERRTPPGPAGAITPRGAGSTPPRGAGSTTPWGAGGMPPRGAGSTLPPGAGSTTPPGAGSPTPRTGGAGAPSPARRLEATRKRPRAFAWAPSGSEARRGVASPSGSEARRGVASPFEAPVAPPSGSEGAHAASSPSGSEGAHAASPPSTAEGAHAASSPAALEEPPVARERLPIIELPPPLPPLPPLAPRVRRASDGLGEEAGLLRRAIAELRQAHDPRAALSALDEHRARFPRGHLRPDADRVRVQALLALDREGEALSLLDRLDLTATPDGGDLQLTRGELRAQRDCRRALADFDDVLRAGPPPPIAERALRARAVCHLRLGDDAAATRDLRAYLTRFPDGKFAAEARARLPP